MAFSKEKAHERAERYAAKGQHDKAAREYQGIVDHDPKDIRAWLMLADCLARSGDPIGAITRYMQVADYYSTHKEHQKALAVYRQVINLDPSRMDVVLKCANLNIETGRVHDAIASYEQIAQSQLQAGKTSDAIRTFHIIADADPSVVSKRLRLAELYSRENMMPEAVNAFRMAADVLLQTNRRSDYVRVAERLLYHHNDDRPTMRQLASVYLELGDPRRALMKLNALLKADQHDHEGLELLADTFMALGKPDKATSVLVELVRELSEAGDAGVPETKRVLGKGLQWSPDEPSLIRLRSELEPPAEAAAGVEMDYEANESEPLELDDDDVVELDEDDVLLEEGSGEAEMPEPAPNLEPVHHARAGLAQANLTASVMDEIASGAPPESASDLDKILFEARVYVKYRLFDHALDHVQELITQEPNHVGALSLRARALGELGRANEAADTHVMVARLVADRDPKLAHEHLEAALQADPGHAEASTLRAAIGSGSVAEPAPTAAYAGDGDSGAFDLDADDFPIEVAEDAPRIDADAGIEVENRFGLSEAGPLPDDGGPPTEGTPPSGFVPRPPPEPQELAPDVTALHRVAAQEGPQEVIDQPTEQFEPAPDEISFEHDMLDLDDETGVVAVEAEPEPEPEPEPVPEPMPMPIASSDEYSDFDVSPEDFAGVELDPALSAAGVSDANRDVGEALDGVLGVHEEEAQAEEGEPEESIAADDGAPVAPPGGWPDISDDLAEIRFFLDQGLDDDAEAALEDLRERYAGHPELAAVDAQVKGAAEPIAPFQSGAQPLLDLVTEEDAEADAYLSAIFSEEGTAAPKRQVEVKARQSDVEGADARDYFDLGMAYREMGLVDEALNQFELAANDPSWRSRALVMAGSLRLHRGETDDAVGNLQQAIETANTDDERCEATYELAVLYEKVGDTPAAIEQFEAVAVGYRDRDERLVALQG